MKQAFVNYAGAGRAQSAVVMLLALLVGCPTAAQAQDWISQGAAPITGGGTENIADEEDEGAIKAVAPHPTDPKIVYVGAVNGGVWQTKNALDRSPHWDPLTDREKSLSIGALAFDPTDKKHLILVAGIGQFSSFWLGGALTGLLRTINGGVDWHAIKVDGCSGLKDPNVTGVAPRGNTIVVSTDNYGLFRGTVNKCLAKISGDGKSKLPEGVSFDLASDPTNPARLFTNAGRNGIYRSTNTGATWTKVSDAAIDKLLSGQIGNVRIAVGRHNNVYVAIAILIKTKDRDFSYVTGIFRSGDGGHTWKQLDLPSTIEEGKIRFGLHPGQQATRHFSIAADPTDPNVVYVGGDTQPAANGLPDRDPHWPNSINAYTYSGRLFRIDASQPAGSQATHITHSNTKSNSAPHADSRGMAFDANGSLLEVDDGGIYRRTDPLTKSGDWFSMNGNLQTGEIHSIAWDANAHIIIGGTQDNGAPQQITKSDIRWMTVVDGDGGFVAVDDFGTPGISVRYSSAQNLAGFVRETYDSANNRQFAMQPGLNVSNGITEFKAQFYTPIELNASDPNRLIIGCDNAVYESPDQGDTIVEIGPNIRVNASGPIAYGAPSNADILYVGFDKKVYVREKPYPEPLVETTTSFPEGYVIGIALDRDHPRVAYVINDWDVYRTPDAGATWEPISGNLGSLSPGTLHSVVYTADVGAGAVVVGTDVGVFRATGPNFSQWERLGLKLPTVPVMRLRYSAQDQMLVAATLGRGAWTLDLSGQKKP